MVIFIFVALLHSNVQVSTLLINFLNYQRHKKGHPLNSGKEYLLRVLAFFVIID